MIIKRLYSSQEVVEGLHLVWDVFIRENANSCTQQGIEEFSRFIKMENFYASCRKRRDDRLLAR